MYTNNDKRLDTVKIERLELDCIIGINPWERLTKQQITVDIEIDTDLTAAGKSDSIEDTINYRTIAKTVTTEVEKSDYGLVESIGAKIADICLEVDRVFSGRVTVRKPGAVRKASAVGIVIRRNRAE